MGSSYRVDCSRLPVGPSALLLFCSRLYQAWQVPQPEERGDAGDGRHEAGQHWSDAPAGECRLERNPVRAGREVERSNQCSGNRRRDDRAASEAYTDWRGL